MGDCCGGASGAIQRKKRIISIYLLFSAVLFKNISGLFSLIFITDIKKAPTSWQGLSWVTLGNLTLSSVA
jgi:hypothetical protein